MLFICVNTDTNPARAEKRIVQIVEISRTIRILSLIHQIKAKQKGIYAVCMGVLSTRPSNSRTTLHLTHAYVSCSSYSRIREITLLQHCICMNAYI